MEDVETKANGDENPGSKTDDEELLADAECGMEVDDIIKLLPMRHRPRLREAVRRGDEAGTAEVDGGGERGRNRERSPRPTKLNDKEL